MPNWHILNYLRDFWPIITDSTFGHLNGKLNHEVVVVKLPAWIQYKDILWLCKSERQSWSQL